MYADSQVLATGDPTLFYNFIADTNFVPAELHLSIGGAPITTQTPFVVYKAKDIVLIIVIMVVTAAIGLAKRA